MDSYDFVCISLEHRKDRRKKITKVFKKLEILNRMNWWIVKSHPSGGIYGCFESHIGVWSSKEFKKKHLCVFEDDILACSDIKEKFKKALKYLSTNKGFDILNLEPGFGYPDKLVENLSTGSRVYSGMWFHTGCYIIRRTSINRCLPELRKWYGADFDTSLHKLLIHRAVFPKLFYQGDEVSDNSGGYRDMLPKINFSSLKRLWKFFPSFKRVTVEIAHNFSGYIVSRNSDKKDLIDRRVKK